LDRSRTRKPTGTTNRRSSGTTAIHCVAPAVASSCARIAKGDTEPSDEGSHEMTAAEVQKGLEGTKAARGRRCLDTA
jgi:hypothetical protein